MEAIEVSSSLSGTRGADAEEGVPPTEEHQGTSAQRRAARRAPGRLRRGHRDLHAVAAR